MSGYLMHSTLALIRLTAHYRITFSKSFRWNFQVKLRKKEKLQYFVDFDRMFPFKLTYYCSDCSKILFLGAPIQPPLQLSERHNASELSYTPKIWIK